MQRAAMIVGTAVPTTVSTTSIEHGDPDRVPAAAVTKVVWTRIGEPRSTRVALVPEEPLAASSPSAPDRTAAAEADPAPMMMALCSERLTANGGFGHPHAATGCGFCRRAAAAYR